MEEGTVVGCLVKVGDQVKKGDIILEVETDKAVLEMQSPADGWVKHILVDIGQSLLVGDAVMVLGEKGEQVPQSFINALKAGAPSGLKTQDSPQDTLRWSDQRPVTPQSTGCLTADTLRWSGEPRDTSDEQRDMRYKLGQTIPLSRMQKAIAQRMLQSKLEIPCFYLTVKADMTELVDYRAKRNKTSEVKLAYNDFIIKAVATGLENFPIMTGQLKDNNIQLSESIGVGLAISVPGGLVAPIVKDAHKKSVSEIAKYSQVLIEKACSSKLSPADMDGGCITVSSLGAFGIDSFIPIVVPGQCSIMGIGQIADTCVPNGGNIVTRKLMTMTLSVDHKITNGAYAAQFLDYVRKLLEDPTNFD